MEPLVGHLIAWFARIRVTDRHTHTHKTTAVALAAHTHRGLKIYKLLVFIVR